MMSIGYACIAIGVQNTKLSRCILKNATEEIKARKGWENINAIKESQVFLIDANASSRPSQNVVKALKEMATAVYPENFK